MLSSHNRIFLIPLDHRPVCYAMPKLLADAMGITLHTPSTNLLGKLKTPANFNALYRWAKNHLFEKEPLIIALDTVAYGGLIPSRINNDSLEDLKKRINKFFSTMTVSSCYAFSSILRIPNYNNAEEEPDYWQTYGKALYQYSWQKHSSAINAETVATVKNKMPEPFFIPEPVLADFIGRREKNFALNHYFMQLLCAGKISYLTYGQDDTGEYGLNVMEAKSLEKSLQENNRMAVSQLKTGMDELAVCMLARWAMMQTNNTISVYPFYTKPETQDCIAKFDGKPVSDVVKEAIETCGASLSQSSEEADLWLVVHTPQENVQLDHAGFSQSQITEHLAEARVKQKSVIAETIGHIRKTLSSGQPVAIADVAYANGADPILIDNLVSQFNDLTGIYGYAGWNTPGNTIGSALAIGLVRLIAERQKTFSATPFCKLLLTRFADDWLYQSVNRYHIKARIDAGEFPPQFQNGSGLHTALNALMADGTALLKNRLGLEQTNLSFTFPCNRLFEIDVVFD